MRCTQQSARLVLTEESRRRERTGGTNSQLRRPASLVDTVVDGRPITRKSFIHRNENGLGKMVTNTKIHAAISHEKVTASGRSWESACAHAETTIDEGPTHKQIVTGGDDQRTGSANAQGTLRTCGVWAVRGLRFPESLPRHSQKRCNEKSDDFFGESFPSAAVVITLDEGDGAAVRLEW